MPVRFRLPYDALWGRVTACLLVANLFWHLVGGRVLEAVEHVLAGALLDTPFYGLPVLGAGQDALLVHLLCLLPAVVRVERPLSLIGFGLALGSGYCTIYLLALFGTGVLLPLAGPLLALVGSVAVLGAMAWGEERARRRQLAQMEQAKQRFTDMLVHDLRSRLSSIGISLSMLEKELKQPTGKAQPLFDAIRGSSARMLLQINALLDIRKMQEGRLALQPQRVALASVIREALLEHAAVAELCGVELKQPEGPEGNALVDLDPEVFSRILGNLLWNALRHAPRGSVVEVALARQERTVEVAIRNGGLAITSAEQSELFQPFVSHLHRTNSLTTPGTGLGLAFCKLAMEAHGGSIRLESPRLPEGDGVCVTLTLPVAVA